MKKVLCTLLAIAMTLSCVSMVTFAKSETEIPDTETIWTMDFDDDTTGATPLGGTGSPSDAAVVASGDDAHQNVYGWTAPNSWSTKGWYIKDYLTAYSNKHLNSDVKITVSADVKVGDEVNADYASTTTIRLILRGTSGGNDASTLLCTTTNPTTEAKGTGAWTTVYGETTIKYADIKSMADNYYRVCFDSIKPNGTTVYVDNIIVTASVGPDATRITFTAATNDICLPMGSANTEIAAAIAKDGTTCVAYKTFKVYSTAAASKTITMAAQVKDGGGWVGLKDNASNNQANVTLTVQPYTWTTFTVPFNISDSKVTSTKGNAIEYAENTFVRIWANSAEVGSCLYIVDVTNPGTFYTTFQYNSGKVTTAQAYSAGVPTPEGVKFIASDSMDANNYYGRVGNIDAEVKAAVEANYTGTKTFKFKIHNTGTVDFYIKLYTQNDWASYAGVYYNHPFVPAGKWAWAYFTLTYKDGNVVNTSGTTVTPSLRIDMCNSAGGTGTAYLGAQFVIETEDLSYSTLASVNTTAFPTANVSMTTDEPETEFYTIGLTNADAEDGTTTSWERFSAAQNGTVSNVEGGANGTAHAIQYSGASSAYASVMYDLGPAIINDEMVGYAGGGAGKYKITFWAKAESGKGGVFSTIINSQFHSSKNGTIGSYTLTYNTYNTGTTFTMTDEWQQFSTVIELNETFIDNILACHAAGADGSSSTQDAYKLCLRLDGSSNAFKSERFTYYVDEVTIEKVAATPTPTAEPDRLGVEYTLSSAASLIKTTEAGGYLGTAYDGADYNGVVVKNYRIYNEADHAIKFETCLQAIYNAISDSSATWAGPSTANSGVLTVPANSYVDFQLFLNVVNGQVTLNSSYNTVAPSKFFIRINLTDAAADDKFILVDKDGANEKLAFSSTDGGSYIYTLPTGFTDITPVGGEITIPASATQYYHNHDITSYVTIYLAKNYSNYEGPVTFSFDVYNTGDIAIGLEVFFQSGSNGYNTPARAGSTNTKNLQPGQMDTLTVTYNVKNGEFVNFATGDQFIMSKIHLRFNTLDVSTGKTAVLNGAKFIVVPKELNGQTVSALTGQYVSTAVVAADIPAGYATPSPVPTATPTAEPTATPTAEPTPTPTVIPTQTVVNGDVELGNTTGWSYMNGGSVAVDSETKATGNYAIKYSGSTSRWGSALYNVTGAVMDYPTYNSNGQGVGYYKVSFDFYANEGAAGNYAMALVGGGGYKNAAQMAAILGGTEADWSATTQINFATLTAVANEWVHYEAVFEVTQKYYDGLVAMAEAGYQYLNCYIRFDGSNGPFKSEMVADDTYWVDNMTIEAYTPTATPTATPEPTATPKIPADANTAVITVVNGNAWANYDNGAVNGLVPMINDAGVLDGIADGEHTITYKIYNPTNNFVRASVSMHTTLNYDKYTKGVKSNGATWTGPTSGEKYIAPYSTQTFDVTFTVTDGEIEFNNFYVGTDENNASMTQDLSAAVDTFFLRFDINGIATGETFTVEADNAYLPTSKLQNVYDTADNKNKANTVTYSSATLDAYDPTVVISNTNKDGSLVAVSGAQVFSNNANKFYAGKGRAVLRYTGTDENGKFLGVMVGSVTYDAHNNETVDINVTNEDIDLTISKAPVAGADEKVVVFYSASGTMVSNTDCSETAATTSDVPTGTTRVGSTFKGWKFEGKTYTTKEALTEAINNSESSTCNISMVYETTAYTVTATTDEVGATVTVTNSSDKACTKFVSFSLVKLSASDVDGKKFAYWEDAAGNQVSSQQDYSFYMLGNDVSLKAVYIDAEDTAPVVNYLAITTNKVNDDNSLTVVAERAFDTSVTIKSHGVMIFESDEDDLTDDAIQAKFEQIIVDGTNKDNVEYKLTSKYVNRLGSYVITKKSTTAGKTYYAAAWAVYEDSEGTHQMIKFVGNSGAIVGCDNLVVD